MWCVRSDICLSKFGDGSAWELTPLSESHAMVLIVIALEGRERRGAYLKVKMGADQDGR